MNEHAVLWPDLVIHSRVIAYPDYITVGTHPVLGMCVVSHYALDELVSWCTHEPIPDELTD